MTLAIKPFKQHPYDLIQTCNWKNMLVNELTNLISSSYEIIKKEAYDEGVPYLADESYLYECFLDNVEHGLVIDNWQVLKYFLAMFRVKIYKNMIGEWNFNTNDVTMYNFFRFLNHDGNYKCYYKRHCKI